MTAGPSAAVVLFVDDEPDILESMVQLLEAFQSDATVLTATSGAQGLMQLEQHEVALVVSDFKMPNMDGLQFLSQVQKRWPGIQRILFTAFADEKLAREAQDHGLVHVFLPKSSSPEQILAAIRGCLAAG